MRSASLITLGCKVNSFDTALIWEGLEDKGYSVSDRMDMSDIYIINTCTVTNNAGSHSRQVIRKAKRMNPDSLVIVTGCHAQVSPEEVSQIAGVDYVVGNQEKERILDIVGNSDAGKSCEIIVDNIFNAGRLEQRRLKSFQKKSRAVLKVQDGCEAFCTYCIIPYARGRSRSLLPEQVEEQVFAMAEKGYHEIVLTGIHLGGYGLDLPGDNSFLSLLKRLDALDADVRFRISSIEPTEIDDEMLEFLSSSEKICRHLHIPLQSGDEGILKRMGRAYTPSFYMNRLEKIAGIWDGAAIGIDIIAGFPGEDEGAFQNSYDLINDSPASYLHVFPFSKRDGTPAAAMKDQVDSAAIKERCSMLRELGMARKSAFCRSFIGERLDAVYVEDKDGFKKTLSDNYIEVMIDREMRVEGRRFEVKAERVVDSVCYGSLITQE